MLLIADAHTPAQQRLLAGAAAGAVALMLQAIPADAAFRLPPIDKGLPFHYFFRDNVHWPLCHLNRSRLLETPLCNVS